MFEVIIAMIMIIAAVACFTKAQMIAEYAM